MAKSFVYNAGSSEDYKKQEELECSYGVFIDRKLKKNKENRLKEDETIAQ